MNVFNKVTLESLKKNKTRTIVTIIGIILSAAMICAATTFTSSMQNYAIDCAVYNNGDWHACVNDTTTEVYEKVSNDERVAQCSYSQNLGYAKIDSKDKNKPYINISATNGADYFNSLPIRIMSGRLPVNSDEIILPESFYAKENEGFKVGETVTLEVGDRFCDGVKLGQQDYVSYYDKDKKETVYVEEEFAVKETHTYKVVGVYENTDLVDYYESPAYVALTVSDGKPVEGLTTDIYYEMNNPSEVYDFTAGISESNMFFNSDVLMLLGVSRYNSFTAVLLGLAAVVIALIMSGSVLLIYNAFSISVSERTKQFGLLSSVGATKKQLRHMVLFEALAVSAVAIPLGILVGIGGIAVTLMLIGDKFNSMVGGSVPVGMKLCVTWQSVVIAAVIALVTVLISAWIPSIRATKVSAIEAIRQNTDVKAKKKQVKTSKLTYKLFGLPGVMAVKQFKRNRSKYRTTIISLIMSVVLFVSASSFTGYLVDSVETGMTPAGYDLSCVFTEEQFNGKSPEEILELLMSDKYVTDGVYVKDDHGIGKMSEKYASDQIKQMQGDGKQTLDVSVAVNFVDDREFKRILKANNLKEEDFYNSDAPKALAQDVCTCFDSDQGKYVTVDFLKGDNCEVLMESYKDIEDYIVSDIFEEDGKKWIEYYRHPDGNKIVKPYDEYCSEYTLSVGKTIKDSSMFVDTSNPYLNLIYPVSMMDKVLPEVAIADYEYYTFYLKSDNHAASFNNINKILTDRGIVSLGVHDHAAQVDSDRNLITIIRVFAYGFLTLISLISVANVFNTISTNISLRRREFAMLKSVGMTQKGFNRMMSFECLLYGLRALLLGLPISLGVTYLIHLAINEGYVTSFQLPLKAMIIATISVFLVVFVTMMYSMRKIKKDNPIDALKNENL